MAKQKGTKGIEHLTRVLNTIKAEEFNRYNNSMSDHEKDVFANITDGIISQIINIPQTKMSDFNKCYKKDPNKMLNMLFDLNLCTHRTHNHI